MEPFHEAMLEYQRQLEKGVIQRAYKGVIEYILDLKAYFNKKYPDYVSGSLYAGYMDMTYFSFNPASLKQRGLKIAIVFIHQAFRFEAWLAGYNKQVQTSYWKLFSDSGWNRYHLVPTPVGVDSILETILVENPDFSNLPALTSQVESSTLEFIKDIEGFLSEHYPVAG